MPLIKFLNKPAEGSYLLATNGEVGGYPGDIFAVSEHLLKELKNEFQDRNITYQKLNPKVLNSDRQRNGGKRCQKSMQL